MGLRIALFRSMVIGGKRLDGATARAIGEAAGGTEVRSVTATGNLVFRSRKAPRTLERELEAACAEAYGKPTEMVVKTAEEWRALLAANPFATQAARTPQRLLVWAMREPLPDAGLKQLQARASGEERVERTAEGDIYMWFGEGSIDGSKLPSGFGLKALGAVGTNRNWNTAMKITRVLEELEGRPTALS